MRKALLIGASGFVGGYLLDLLLNDPDYESVLVVARKEMTLTHPKLHVIIGTFNSVIGMKDEFIATDVYVATGTTHLTTWRLGPYYQTHLDYPVRIAKLARENGATSVAFISALTARRKSLIIYIRAKGNLEREMIALNYKHTHIFRPCLLQGRESEFRIGECIANLIWSATEWLFTGSFKKYRSLEGEELACAMVNGVKSPTEKVRFYYWEDMMALQ